MAHRCEICNKGPKTGNNRAHSNKATKRVFKPNIFKKRVADFSDKKIKICSSCYKRLTSEGVL